MRIGIGYDIHPLVEGKKLILGGVNIPYEKGLAGYSDADVLLHSIADALLGAAGKEDIGHFFPDTNPQYKGISSLVILERVFKILKKDNFKINNIDTVIIAEEPHLASYIPEMKKNIAHILQIPSNYIGIKATTSEGLGFIGEKKAIASLATVTIKKLA